MDEAHKLPETARQMFGVTLTAEDIHAAAASLRAEHFPLAADLLLEAAAPLLRKLSRPAKEDASFAEYAKLLAAPERKLVAIRRQLQSLLTDSRVREFVSLSPFDYEHNCLLYLPPPPAPSKRNGPRQTRREYAGPPHWRSSDYYSELAAKIAALLDAAHGHALVLFTSYAAMSAVKDKLKTPYPPLEKVPPRLAILKRNEWMVSASDVVVSGVTHGWGGAAKTLYFAKRKKKVIFQYPVHAGESCT